MEVSGQFHTSFVYSRQSTPINRGWLDPKAALSVLGKKKNLLLSECSNMADRHGYFSVGLVETTSNYWS